MDIYMIRLKRHPNRYVSKYSPTYAINTDPYIESLMSDGDGRHPDADSVIKPNEHWFAVREKAKIWTSEKAVRAFVGKADKARRYSLQDDPTHPLGISLTPIDLRGTLSEYELEIESGGVVTVKPLDDIR